MLNTPDDRLLENVRTNLKAGLKEVREGKEKGLPLAIVGGGPSLNENVKYLNKFKRIVALNGTHDWLLSKGIKPFAMVMTDARQENIEFVRHPKKYIKYYLSSKCHTDVFEALSRFNVTVFHEFEGIGEHVINGGSTVGLRSISLFHFLGYRDFYLFGFDSCYADSHHAYNQPLNDNEKTFEVKINGKTFKCADWMIEQAADFELFLDKFSHLFDISIIGEGLLTETMRNSINESSEQCTA